MDRELGCDFYFGDQVFTPIKIMNVENLSGYKKTIPNIKILFGKFLWQKGVIHLVFKRYNHFILTGEVRCLSNIVIALLCKLLKKKVYLWMHGQKKDIGWKERYLAFIFYNLAYRLLLYGNYSRNFMIQRGIDPNKMICIYNSLDYDKQIKIRVKLAKTNIYKEYFHNDFPVLIFIGRIQKSKKIDLLFNSVCNLKEEGIHCNVVLIGENVDEININQIICNLDLNANIWIYGSCYEELKIGELIFNADVCVSPGDTGLTILHCFMYGTPVITHNNFANQGPEFEIIQPGINGDFFEDNNPDDLAMKIKRWIFLDKKKRKLVRLTSYNAIDDKYNPHFQIKIFKTIFNISW